MLLLEQAPGGRETLILGVDENGSTPWCIALKRYSLEEATIRAMGRRDRHKALHNRLGDRLGC